MFGVPSQAFRMQQESRAGLSFLSADDQMEDAGWDLATIRASHAETVLELQKTRQLLLLEHHISQDLQVHKVGAPWNTPGLLLELLLSHLWCLKDELKMVTQKMEKEREESQRRLAAKDKLLSKRALHLNTLQGISTGRFLGARPPSSIFSSLSLLIIN